MIRISRSQAKSLGIDPKDSIRTPQKRLSPSDGSIYRSRLEERFAGLLELCRASGAIDEWSYEPFGLILAGNTKYFPDFLSESTGCKPVIWEIKGNHRWDDSIVKLKVAAKLYDDKFEFKLVTYDKYEWWRTQDVSPQSGISRRKEPLRL